MSTDIANLGFDVNSGPIVKAEGDLNDLAMAADRAGNEVQDLGNKSKAAGAQSGKMAASAATSSGAVKGLGRNAGMAGIQVQQLVGQIQGGQSAFVALSQQSADLGFVLGAPMVGVIVSLGAVLAGTLVSALNSTVDGMDDLMEKIRETTDEFKNMSNAQKEAIRIGRALEQQSLTDEIEKQARKLSNARDQLAIYNNQWWLFNQADNQLGMDTVSSAIVKQADKVSVLAGEYDTLVQSVKQYSDETEEILNGTFGDDDGSKKSFWGTDESVERAAFDIRMGIFREEQDAIAAARQENVDGYQSILQMQFQAGLAYKRLEVEAEEKAQRAKSRAYQEYTDARVDADKAAAAAAAYAELAAAADKIRIKKATEQNMLDIDKSYNSLFTTMMAAQNKEIFEIGKIGAAGKAANDAYGAINATLAQGGALAAPAAWAIGAAAFANVTSILSSQYGSPSSGGGGGASIPDPVSVTNNESTQNVQNTFNISGGNADSIAAQIQELFDSGSMAIKNGSVVSV